MDIKKSGILTILMKSFDIEKGGSIDLAVKCQIAAEEIEKAINGDDPEKPNKEMVNKDVEDFKKMILDNIDDVEIDFEVGFYYKRTITDSWMTAIGCSATTS